MAATLHRRTYGLVEMGCLIAELHRSPFGRDLIHNAMHEMGLRCDMCDEQERA